MSSPRYRRSIGCRALRPSRATHYGSSARKSPRFSGIFRDSSPVTIGPRGVRRPCVAVRCNPMRTDVRRCGDAVDGRSVRRPIRRKGEGAKGRPTYRPRLPPSAIARVARSPAPDRHRLGAGHAGEHGGAGRNSSRQARAGRGADSGGQRRTRGESKIGRGPDGRGSRCTAPARARALRATR